MKTIGTMAQAENAKAGVYRLDGATGVTFRKVTDTVGAGAFNQRYWRGGERRTMSLGPLSRFASLADACKRSREVLTERDKGVDPIEKRNAEKAANLAAKTPVNFGQATETHVAAHAPSWKGRYARRDWVRPIEKYSFPIIGDLPVNDIVATHVATVVRAAAADGNLETGKRVQQRIRKIINGAIARGERDPLRGNPADAELIGAIVPLKRKTVHFRRIQLDDAPAVFRALHEALGRATGPKSAELAAWVFMIACSLRPSEALHARWGEISLDKKLLVIGRERMKSDREHRVPLSSLAIEILERRDRVRVRTGDEKVDAAVAVFAGVSGGPPGYTNFALAPKREGIDAGSPHSWRSVFSDWRGNKTNFPRELGEFALAHLVPGVAGDYQRETAPERRVELMTAYSRWLAGDAGAEVIVFPAPARVS